MPRRITKRRTGRVDAYEALGPWAQLDMDFAHRPVAARRFWDEHGEAFLEGYIREHPGQRPIWWWKLYAPKDAIRVVSDGGPGELVIESSAVYLHRHGLLTPFEQGLWDRDELPATEIWFKGMAGFNGLLPVRQAP